MDDTERQRLLALPLEDKIEASKAVVAEACRRFGPDRLALAWTGAKDSTLTLWLAKQAAEAAGVPLPRAVTIDEGDGFPELRDLIERVSRDWGVTVVPVGNREILDRRPAIGDYIPVDGLGPENRAALEYIGFTGPGFPFDPESPVGNHLMKVVPLNAFLVREKLSALVTAIRWDEHPARAGEDYYSPRTEPPHVRVHPLLHMRERDVWDITLSRGLPYCELYRLGYRSLGTRTGTVRASDKPAWEQDLENTPERAGRDQEKEEAMEQLRSLGYM